MVNDELLNRLEDMINAKGEDIIIKDRALSVTYWVLKILHDRDAGANRDTSVNKEPVSGGMGWPRS